ncbi:MAG: efflux transporter outer membrane subunit [Burkholderiales bacterium]|nr:efflux transporter outer membrane subunit [Burkholderiales bacterium]
MLERHWLALALAAAFVGAPAAAEPLVESAATTAPVSAGAGWHALGDPVLSGLIERGLAANHNAAQALARLERARSLEQGAHAQSAPGGSVRLEATGSKQGSLRRSGVELDWELDLFGRLRTRTGAATQRVVASAAELEGVRLAIGAGIAHTWFEVLGAREQLALARSVADNRASMLKLVQSRARHGLAAPIDEARASAELEAAQADLPVREAALQVATHRFAVLLGESPAGFAVPAEAAARAIPVQLAIPAAATWLARRPDIRQHEAQLRSSEMDVEAVRSEFYPRITIGGLLGFIGGSAAAVASSGSLSWMAGPTLLAPLFDRPRIEARLAGAKAGKQEALAAYRQRILLAVEEVENAVARHAAGQRQLQSLERRAHHASNAQRLARTRFEAGAADMLELLDAQRTAQQATAALSEALTAQRQGVVAVLKAVAAGA